MSTRIPTEVKPWKPDGVRVEIYNGLDVFMHRLAFDPSKVQAPRLKREMLSPDSVRCVVKYSSWVGYNAIARIETPAGPRFSMSERYGCAKNHVFTPVTAVIVARAVSCV